MEGIVIFRIVLIVLLVLVSVFGFLNQRKRNKMRKGFETDYSDYGTYVSPTSDEDLSEEEKVAKEYINNNSSYPRESLKSALIQTGYSEEDVEKWLDKYL